MRIGKLEMKKARVLANMKQADVAEKMNVSTAAICQWETGKLKMPDERFDEYCSVIGFSPSDVFLPEVLN